MDQNARQKMVLAGAAGRVRRHPRRRARLSELARGLPQRPVHRVDAVAGPERVPAARRTTTTRCSPPSPSRARRRTGSTSVPGWVWALIAGRGRGDRRGRGPARTPRSSRTRPEREGSAVGSRRYLLSKTLQALVTLWFVLTFNFFLFRDPARGPGGGARAEREAHRRRRRAAATRARPRPADAAAIRDLHAGDPDRRPRRVAAHRRAGEAHHRHPSLADRRCWSGSARSSRRWFGVLIGIRGGWRRGSTVRHDVAVQLVDPVLDARGLARHVAAAALLGLAALVPGGRLLVGRADRHVSRIVDVADHLFLPLLTLTLGYIGGYSIIMRSSMIDTDARGLRADRASEGRARTTDPQAPRRAERIPADVHADLPELRVRARRRDRDRDGVLVAGPRGTSRTTRSRPTTTR